MSPRIATVIRSLLVTGLVLFFLTACRKKSTAPRVEPHSAEAVLLAMDKQAHLLKEAATRNDLTYVHDYSYYFSTLTKSLPTKLNAEQKSLLANLLAELNSLTEQLDMASGRQHSEATQASINQLLMTLEKLEKEFNGLKLTPKSASVESSAEH